MPLADATAIVEGDRFLIQPHDANADYEKLTELAGWCNQFSPIVGVDAPDSLYFDLQGVTHLSGDESTLAGRVTKEFCAKRYWPRLAIADTPGAAWAAAHFSNTSSTIIPPPEIQSLFELPVEALRLPVATLKKLDRLGIHRIGQLVALPRKSLPSRIGQEAIDRLDYLTGDKIETICGHKSLPTFEQQWLLDQATDHWTTIKHVVHVLLERLANQLRRHSQGANRLTICLDCLGNQSVRIDIGLYRPSASARRFDSLAQMQLETAKLSTAVQCVTAVADETEPLEQRQHSLLAAENCTDSRELADLVERLSSRIGTDRVIRALPVDDWQPEKAFCYQPLTESATGHKSLPGASAFGSNTVRPLRMFFPPEPINVSTATSGGPPTRFHYRGEQQIANCWGPERLETAWWRGAYVRRDYYRVETTSASRFWIFRCLGNNQWFLHGSFD